MNKREAKRRALKLCAHILKEAIDSGKFTDMVDDDTTDDEAERITLEADEIRFRLQERAESLEAIEHRLAERQGGTLPAIKYLDPNTQTHSENGVVYFRPAPKA